jgi:hypothetical protein
MPGWRATVEVTGGRVTSALTPGWLGPTTVI